MPASYPNQTEVDLENPEEFAAVANNRIFTRVILTTYCKDEITVNLPGTLIIFSNNQFKVRVISTPPSTAYSCSSSKKMMGFVII
jgi:flagellar assembly factor FliW